MRLCGFLGGYRAGSQEKAEKDKGKFRRVCEPVFFQNAPLMNFSQSKQGIDTHGGLNTYTFQRPGVNVQNALYRQQLWGAKTLKMAE
jgi:hypothetical protein